MRSLKLLLYGRKGCCLCEGLEEKLRDLRLYECNPPLELDVVDIDNASTQPALRAKYDYLVPVLALHEKNGIELAVLPRVSPRLKGEGLLVWLQQACMRGLSSD